MEHISHLAPELRRLVYAYIAQDDEILVCHKKLRNAHYLTRAAALMHNQEYEEYYITVLRHSRLISVNVKDLSFASYMRFLQYFASLQHGSLIAPFFCHTGITHIIPRFDILEGPHFKVNLIFTKKFQYKPGSMKIWLKAVNGLQGATRHLRMFYKVQHNVERSDGQNGLAALIKDLRNDREASGQEMFIRAALHRAFCAPVSTHIPDNTLDINALWASNDGTMDGIKFFGSPDDYTENKRTVFDPSQVPSEKDDVMFDPASADDDETAIGRYAGGGIMGEMREDAEMGGMEGNAEVEEQATSMSPEPDVEMPSQSVEVPALVQEHGVEAPIAPNAAMGGLPNVNFMPGGGLPFYFPPPAYHHQHDYQSAPLPHDNDHSADDSDDHYEDGIYLEGEPAASPPPSDYGLQQNYRYC